MNGFIKDIEKTAKANKNFRQEIETGDLTQVVVMSIPPGGEIGMEVHEDTDQVLYILEGKGQVFLGDTEGPFEDGDIILVHKGTWHNFINTDSDDDLKIITTYSPPHHKPGTVHATKADADAAEAAEHH